MKTVQLTAFERLMIIDVLGGVKGDLNTIRRAIKVAENIDLTEVQRKTIELEYTPAGVKWNPKKAKKMDKCKFDLEDADFSFIKSKLNTKDDWPADKRIMEMLDKINSLK